MTTFDDADDTKTREHALFQIQRNRALEALAECQKRVRERCGDYGGDLGPESSMRGSLILAMFALCFGLICGFVAGMRHGETKLIHELEGKP